MRKAIITLVALLCIAFCFVGCSRPNTQETTSTTAKDSSHMDAETRLEEPTGMEDIVWEDELEIVTIEDEE